MIVGVYGSGGCGRGVLPVIRDQYSAELDPADLYFVDDTPTLSRINGHSVLSFDDFVSLSGSLHIVLAIADSTARRRLDEKCSKAGLRYLSVRAQNSVLMDKVSLGEGHILSPFVTITANVRIGRQFHANLYSYVEHDCVIGDFVTFAPSVRCNGNVVIEDNAYIGTGAIIKQGQPGNPLVIGKNAVVGMGAVVTRSVPPNTTVVGVPARPRPE